MGTESSTRWAVTNTSEVTKVSGNSDTDISVRCGTRTSTSISSITEEGYLYFGVNTAVTPKRPEPVGQVELKPAITPSYGSLSPIQDDTP